MYRKKKPIAMHTWLLPLFMAVFGEVMVYLWTMETFVLGRFLQIFSFALGFGGVLALISSLFAWKAPKVGPGIVGFLVAVLYIAEYLINDTFQVFMGVDTIGAGAVGVLNNYMRIVVEELLANWWQVLLILLPLVLYALLVEPKKTGWKSRTAMVILSVAMYAAGLGLVKGVKLDQNLMGEDYNFDSAVRAFGVHMGFVLDAFSDTSLMEPDMDFEFVEPETTVPADSTAAESTAAESTPEDVTTAATETVPETTAPTEPVGFQPHVFDIDFAALAAEETNSSVASMHKYVASQTPTMENEYTGLFKGKNLIFLTAEAFTGAFIDPELTPTLYRLATEGIHFTNYYQPVWGAGTTGGEYSNLVGLMPINGSCMKEAMQQDLFLTIGNQLQKQGYSSAAFHNNDYTYYDRHKTHTLLGYDYFMGYGNGIEAGVKDCWPQSDLEMIDFTVPMYIDKQPFSVYYMTVSGHSTYYEGSAMVDKNLDKVKHLKQYKFRTRCYIATQMELEAALTSLLAQLEAAGIMDDTVIVVSSDHYPYGLVTDGTSYIPDLIGQKESDFTRDKNTLIIWSGAIEDMDIVVDEPVMSLDILPTLSNLFDVEFDSRLLVGRDVFSEAEPLVIWGVSGNWMTDKGTYKYSTGKFTPFEGVEVPKDYGKTINAIARNKVKYSKGVISNDYFNYVKDALGYG